MPKVASHFLPHRFRQYLTHNAEVLERLLAIGVAAVAIFVLPALLLLTALAMLFSTQ